MRCGEVLRTDCHFFVRLRLNVAKPIRIRTGHIGYENLGTFFSVVDNFQHGLRPKSGKPTGMSQQQQTFSKQPPQAPALKEYGSPKQVP